MPEYGSDEAIQQLLRSADDATFSEDEQARITALRTTVSLAVEHDTGATFLGSAPSATVREQEGDGTRRLYLDLGAREVSAITETPDWIDGVWSGGTALTTDSYRLTARVANGAYRVIERMDAVWSGVVLVSGVWEDTYTAVPADIDYAVNFVAAEVFKAQQATPHGLMGTEGALVPIRKALQVDEIKRILTFYRVGPGMWVIG